MASIKKFIIAKKLFEKRSQEPFLQSISIFFLLLSLTVNIVDEKQKIIVRRPFTIDPKGARCQCLWHCSCFCFGSFLTTEVNDLCDTMSMKSEIYAGFYDEQNFEDIEAEMDDASQIRRELLIWLPLAIFLFALFLGKFWDRKILFVYLHFAISRSRRLPQGMLWLLLQ